MLRLTWLALAAVLLAGCTLPASRQQMYYPTYWAPILSEAARGCASIVGNFQAIGENAQASPNGLNSPTLMVVLGIAPRPNNYACAQLHLNKEQSILSVIASGGVENGSAHLAVACVGGNLTHQDKPGSSYSDGSDHSWSGSEVMSLANDGSLVVRTIGKATTDDLLFRSSLSYDNYYRFKPCASTSGA